MMKEAAMDTMTALETEVHDVRHPDAVAPPSERRRAAAATMVAGLYVLLVLGAPLIVRYGPDPESVGAPAAVAVREAGAPRCASAPEYGNSCQGGDTIVTQKAFLPIALR
jgi:hypothetical protein